MCIRDSSGGRTRPDYAAAYRMRLRKRRNAVQLHGQQDAYRCAEAVSYTHLVIEALMTAEQNGLIEESRFDLDNNGDLRIFYHTTEESAATINNYIKD